MSPTEHPIQCRICGSTAGPFVRLAGRPLSRRPLCEDCHDAQDGKK
ncbi:hypothetical protein ACWCXC_31830 [Streptomyces sp. NPDC001515]